MARAARGDADAPGEDVTGPLARSGEGYIAFSVEHVGLFRAMFHPALGVEPSPEDPHRVAMDATWAYLVSVVEMCQGEGIVRSGDAEQLARLAWSTVHGAAALLVDGALGADADVVAQTLLRDLKPVGALAHKRAASKRQGDSQRFCRRRVTATGPIRTAGFTPRRA
ncbi:MAG: TetR-like C-terminal domain-containing protein [Nannocystaceae bacterium]|nr:WHG domain-containing protein [bacterium]